MHDNDEVQTSLHGHTYLISMLLTSGASVAFGVSAIMAVLSGHIDLAIVNLLWAGLITIVTLALARRALRQASGTTADG